MPIAFAPLVALALGAALAWTAAPELARGEGRVASSRPFAVVAAFAALVWLPAVGYFVAFHGDWSYLYVVPWRRVPSVVDLGLVVASAGVLLAGFVLAVRPVRTRRHGPVVALVVVPSIAAAAGLVLSASRLSVSGTYAQFHGGFGTEPIGQSTLGKAVLFMGAVLVLGVGWAVRSLLALASEARV